MTTETTALTVTERAAVALGAKDYELKLAELVKSSCRIVAIKNPDGYKEAHGARMSLKNTRVAIQKAGKDAREDAQAFSKAVISEEKRLTALIEPEEGRLQALQDEWDAAREAEKQAAIQAEQARIERHQAAIRAMRESVVIAATETAFDIATTIAYFEGYSVSEDAFQEFAPAAHKARGEVIAALQSQHAAAVAREAEAARLQAEREELARLRAEQEQRDAAERAKIAAEQQAEAERLAGERRQFEEEQRALRAAQAEMERKAAEARAAEQARIDAERAELRRQQDAIAAELRRKQDEEAAAARAEADRVAAAAHKVEVERVAAEHAEAERLRRIDADARLCAAEARAKTNAIRIEIDAELDVLNDAQLQDVLAYVCGMTEWVVPAGVAA